ncbi:MAG: two-component regulator propeller domain-containing protein [Bacteroidota bacterium]
MYKRPGTKGIGVYDVAESKDGRHWMATNKGLYVYDPQEQRGQLYQQDAGNPASLPDPYIFNVLVDREDRLWLGLTRGGLARLENEAEQSFTNWRANDGDSTSIIADMILDMLEDDRGRIWLATPEGISVYLGNDQFRSFTDEDGLPNNLVFGLLNDDHGNLWVSTPGGLAKTSLPEDDGPLKIWDVFHTQDGLPIARAQYGFMRFDDGRFAMAGYGLQLFHPDSLHRHLRIGEVALTEFRLFEKPAIYQGNGLYTVAAAPNTLQKLRLQPRQNFPAFSFAELNYHPFRKVDYEYRLLGMHNDWLSTGQRRHLAFPKLDPGHYQLQLRARNPSSQEIGPVTSLAIVLPPPWYQRWWAYTIYGLTVTGLVLGWLRMRERQRQRVIAARLNEREEFRRRSARDFHDEAGNYLTRVGLLTEVARRQGAVTESGKPLLDQIDQNVQVLREGMRDFIWALDPDNDNAYELVLRLKRFGQEIFTHHPARVQVIGLTEDLQEVKLRSDQRRHLTLILKEAMHNSLKHAMGATIVRLEVNRLADGLEFSWTDNGPGLAPQEYQKVGNGLKNMRSRADKIGAQFHLSGQTDGTTIQVILSNSIIHPSG